MVQSITHLTRLVLAVIQSCTGLEYHHLVERCMCSPGYMYLAVQCHVVDWHSHQNQKVGEEVELVNGNTTVEM